MGDTAMASHHDFGDQLQTVLSVSEGLEILLVPGEKVDEEVVEMVKALCAAANRLAQIAQEKSET